MKLPENDRFVNASIIWLVQKHLYHFFNIEKWFVSAGLFALAGFYQMAVWAIGKHKLYKKEFPNYPKGRKAILPFLI